VIVPSHRLYSQDLGLDMGDLDGLTAGSSGGGGGGGGNRGPANEEMSRAWEEEMAEMDRFLGEAVGSGAGGGGGGGSFQPQPAKKSPAYVAGPPPDTIEKDATLDVKREKPKLVQTQFADGDVDRNALPTGLDDVDNLLGQIKGEESHQLATTTQYIVNQDAISNCVIDYISLFTKVSTSGIPQEELAEFVSLAEYLREEVMANYDKFALWLETLPNENLVSLHANRNQLKQSSAALLDVVKRYSNDPRKNTELSKELLTRTQTIVGDCWSFYVKLERPLEVRARHVLAD
jgi:hypothetical protein